MKRHIEPAMVAFLDRKLRDNGLAQHAVSDKLPRMLFRLAMESCVGIREKSGRNDGPMVELIQQTIGEADGEAWCMALVQTCLAYAEVKIDVVSPIAASEHCLTVWAETPRGQRVKNIATTLPGAIVIWRQGTTSSGHTGATIHPVEYQRFDLVEGNTTKGNAGGKIIREGGGIYVTNRSIIGDGSLHVVGALKPF